MKPSAQQTVEEIAKVIMSHKAMMPWPNWEEIEELIKIALTTERLSREEVEKQLGEVRAEAGELKADEVTLAFFRKYLKMPDGSLQQLCEKAEDLFAQLTLCRVALEEIADEETDGQTGPITPTWGAIMARTTLTQLTSKTQGET